MPGGLPPELLDLIFSHLHEDDWEIPKIPTAHGKYELDSCSRVCRIWSAAARPHLFRDVTYSFRAIPYDAALNEQGDYKDTLRKYECLDLQYKADARYKTFPMFFSFVQQSPMAQNSIRRLRLDAWPRGKSPFFDNSDCIDANVLAQLLQLLHRLRVLHLCNVGVAHLPVRSAPVPHPSLRRLFVSCEVETDGIIRSWPDMDVADVLDCFAKLEELQLDLPDVPEFVACAHPDWPPLEIGTLILGDSVYLDGGLFEYLELRRIQSMRCLTLEHVSPDSAAGLLGPLQFEELRMECPEIGEFFGLEGMFNISVCKNLRHLVVNLPFLLTDDLSPAALSGPSMFPDFVRSIDLLGVTLPQLQKLTLHLRIGVYAPLYGEDSFVPEPTNKDELNEFDNTLLKLVEHFDLSGITFDTQRANPSTTTMQAAEDVLRRCCPRLTAKRKYSFGRDVGDLITIDTDRFLV